MPDIKQIIDHVYSQENLSRINSDYERYKIYNGKLRETIKAAIKDEFILPETVEQLTKRIIPINITQKIVNKLAGVYIQAPLREPVDGNEDDLEAIQKFVEWTGLNKKMKQANRFLKLHKHALIEPYLTSEGKPAIRVIPSHKYTPFSDDENEPEKATAIVKHMNITSERADDRHHIWTKDHFFAVTGNGDVIANEFNPENINPYGVLPFKYIKESDDLILPIQDDDLISMQIAICLLLTDLAFASKYQAWSLIWVTGKLGKVAFNPASIIELPTNEDGSQAQIGTIKPEIDSDAMLRQVEALLGMLLTTKNLSVGDVSLKLETNPTSGVAKILDKTESTEDRTDQVAFFDEAEKEIFHLIAHVLMPKWVEAGVVDTQYALSFSEEFQLSISFPDMRPMVSDKDKVDIEVAKLKEGLTSRKEAIKAVNPELKDEQVNDLMLQIKNEKSAVMEDMIRDLKTGDDGEQS